MVRPYHIAPNVSYANKLVAIMHFCGDTAKSRVLQYQGKNTSTAYLECWRDLVGLVGDDATQVLCLTKNIAMAVPTEGSIEAAAHYLYEVENYMKRLAADHEPENEDALWTKAWEHVCAKASRYFKEYMMPKQTWHTVYKYNAAKYYCTQPRVTLVAFRRHLDDRRTGEAASEPDDKVSVMQTGVEKATMQGTDTPSAEPDAASRDKQVVPVVAANVPAPATATPAAASKSKKRKQKCVICSGEHHVKKFPIESYDEPHQMFVDKNKCFNCGNPQHVVNECTSCWRCQKCWK
jgi:hypothetical protein